MCIAQTPAPLVSMHEGDVVALVLSQGGQPNLRVPEFVGLTVERARALAAGSGLKLGQIVWTPLGPGAPAHGEVVRQLPPPDTKIASYDPVSLQVSAGPYESGYILHQVHVLVAVPDAQDANGSQLDVRLSLTDATGQYDLYRAFAEPGQKLDFTVTAVGTSVLDMFVNDQLVGETRLGAEPPAVYNEKASPSPSP